MCRAKHIAALLLCSVLLSGIAQAYPRSGATAWVDTARVHTVSPIQQDDCPLEVRSTTDPVRMTLLSYRGDRRTALEAERTERFYDSLQTLASRNRFLSWVHDLVIVPVRPTTMMKPKVVDETAIYRRWNGMRIAAIEFEQSNVFDPAHSYLEKAANAVHAVTRERTVRRDLLFHAGEPFNAETVVRYKQLLRSRQYIANANIEVMPDSSPDACDCCCAASFFPVRLPRMFPKLICAQASELPANAKARTRSALKACLFITLLYLLSRQK